MNKLLVTGGMGFIGSNFVREWIDRYEIVNLDKLTYAGNPANLKDIEDHPNYEFVKGDIRNEGIVEDCMKKDIDAVINFAAETHVDRSIMYAGDFIETDMYGTFVLLEASKKYDIDKFIQISTDEVYGSILEGKFKETDPINPGNPYSASKAGADRLASAYHNTYGLPVTIARPSNNYGPYQYPEKLIPLFTTNAIDDKELPIYGDGSQVRDWLYVKDNCEAIEFLLRKGKEGEAYNIGGENERTNMEITNKILEVTGKEKSLIKYVEDRPGHDERYALDNSKINKLGWEPKYNFDEAMKETIEWYMENEDWWRPIKSGEFKEYYEEKYKDL